jgi:hypothetical protein
MESSSEDRERPVKLLINHTGTKMLVQDLELLSATGLQPLFGG